MSLPKPRPGVMKVSPYVGGDARIPGLAEPIVLASNEAAIGPSPKAIAAYEATAARLHRYPDGASAELRAALAARHGIPAENIVCSNGSDELITLLTRAYAGPGDEVLFTEHGFAMYPIATLAAGATPVAAAETDLTADVDKLLAKLSDRTRIVFLANPNNPTGSFLTADEVARLHAGLPQEVLFVIDAAYAEYIARNDYTPGLELVAKHGNVVMTRTFSKIYALAGLRLGWAYAPAAVVDVLNRVRNPFNVTLPAQAAGVAALEDVAHLDEARTHNDHWRPWFAERLTGMGLEVAPSVANFVLVRFPADEAHCADKAYDFLLSKGVIARRVGGYGLPAHLRISIGLEHEVRATADALEEFLA